MHTCIIPQFMGSKTGLEHFMIIKIRTLDMIGQKCVGHCT